MADNSGTASPSTGDTVYAAALAALQTPAPEAGATAAAAVPPAPTQETQPQPRVPPPGLVQVSQVGQARRDRVMGVDGGLRRKGRSASPRKVDPLALWHTLPPATTAPTVTQPVNVKVPETPPPTTPTLKTFDIASPLGDMNVEPKDERWHHLVDSMQQAAARGL